MRPDLGLRPYRPADRDALYDLCLRTGNLGDDASADHADPELLGHVYVGPYLELEPGLAFVLHHREDPAEPLGYVVGTADTARFEAACEERWWPALRERHRAAPPVPGTRDAGLVRMIEAGLRTDADWLPSHPAHLHINLRAEARGGGGGRALVTRLLDELAARDVPGVHLVVAAANAGGIAFYRRLGFTVLDELPSDVRMGRPVGPTTGGAR
jgi:ribosomal protein S18 acetylase RimI-like enzyme